MAEFSYKERLVAARQLVRLRYPHLQDEETSNNEIRRWAMPGFDIMTDLAISIQCELNIANAKLAQTQPSSEVHLPWEEVCDDGISYIFDAQEMQIVEGEPEAIQYIMQNLFPRSVDTPSEECTGEMDCPHCAAIAGRISGLY